MCSRAAECEIESIMEALGLVRCEGAMGGIYFE